MLFWMSCCAIEGISSSGRWSRSSRILAIVAIAAAPKNNVVEAAKMAQRGANSCSAASASDAPRLVTSHPAIIRIQSHTSRDGFQN